MSNKDIKPRNDKGQSHGFWELYWSDGSLWYKRFYHNGDEVGYEEWHGLTDTKVITSKLFFLK